MEEMENMTVDVAEDGAAYDTETADTSTTEETTEVVDTQAEDNSPKGEKNSYFARSRRREELEQYRTEANSLRAKSSEYEQKIAAYEEREKRIHQLLGNYYEGADLDSQMLNMEAQIKGVSVADLQAQREAQQQQMQAQQAAADELAYYKGIVEKMQYDKAKQIYDEDLATLQELDGNIKNLEELGSDFIRLRFTKNPLTDEYYSATDVYNHLKSKIKPLPQTSGTVNTAAEEKKEIDFMKMPAEEFEKYFNKVMYGG